MKIVLTLLAFAFIIFSCNNESHEDAPTEIKRDTVTTLAAYMGYGLKSIHWGRAVRITTDSLSWVDQDSSTKKKRWDKVSYYIAPVPVQVDSVIAKQFNAPLLNNEGKPNVLNLNLILEAKYVRDGITDLDSSIKYLEKYLITDTTSKK